MFKIIKTSTYNQIVDMINGFNLMDRQQRAVIDLQASKIKDLELQLHTLTAEKLPIKKSKNK